MRRVLVRLAFAWVGAFGLGWLTGGGAAPAREQIAAANATTPIHGGAIAGAAGEKLSALGFGALPVEEIAAPPPPPDIAVFFRHDLTAIQRRPGGALVALIVDLDATSGRRALGRGDVYRDGWRVAAISAQVVELRRQGEVRRINVFEAPAEVLP